MCEVHGMIMVWHNSYTYKINKWMDICTNKNINFHNYVTKIHNFGLIPICGQHDQIISQFNY